MPREKTQGHESLNERIEKGEKIPMLKKIVTMLLALCLAVVALVPCLC